jgi:uncharacterized protein (DUF2147 family)
MVTVTYSLTNVKPESSSFYSDSVPGYHERDPAVVARADGSFYFAAELQNIATPTSNEIVKEQYTIDGYTISEIYGPVGGGTVLTADPAVAQLAGGRMVVTWTQSNGASPGIHFAMTDPESGAIVVPDTLLPGTTSIAFVSDVAALHDGGFAVVYQNNIGPADQDAVLRIYNSSGGMVTSSFLDFASTRDELAPDVSVLNNGNIAVAYSREHTDGSGTYDMAIEIFRPDGIRILGPFAFDATGNQNREPATVALHDGGFAVVYQDDQYAGGNGLTVAFFTSDGTFRGTARADPDSFTDTDASITVQANGFVTVTWTDAGTNILTRTLDPLTMTAVNGPSFVQIENQTGIQKESSVAGLANGTMVTVWGDENNAIEDGNNDPDGAHVSIQIDAVVRTSVGTSANETFRGDALRDVFMGNLGNDAFVYARGGHADTINDFVAGGTDDTITLAGFSDVHNFSDVLGLASQVGADTVIAFGGGDTLTLKTVTRTNLTAADFNFHVFENNASLQLNAFGASDAAGGWNSADHYPRLAVDVDGDAKADIVGFGGSGVFVSLNTGSGFGAAVLALNAFGASDAAGGWSSNDTYHRTMADVDGDGKADIIGFGAAGTFVSLRASGGYFADPIVGVNAFGASASGGGWSSDNLYHREVADVNGDGKADIVGFGSSGVYVALATSNGNFADPFFSLNSFGSSAAGGGWNNDGIYHREMADVNGDGKADIVGFGGAGVSVPLATTGGHFADATLALNSFGTSDSSGGWSSMDQFPRHLADVNGDGRADVVGFGAGATFVALGRSDGSFDAGTADVASFGASASAGGWSSNELYPRVLADIDGGGAADIVGFGSPGVIVAHSNVDWFV